MTWAPSKELVEKAARAMCAADGREWDLLDEYRDPADVNDPMCKAAALSIARATLIAARDEIVAEAVREEREACAAVASAEQMMFDTSRRIAFRDGWRCAAGAILSRIRARSS